MKRKLLSVLLCLSMALTLVPSALAANEPVNVRINGETKQATTNDGVTYTVPAASTPVIVVESGNDNLEGTAKYGYYVGIELPVTETKTGVKYILSRGKDITSLDDTALGELAKKEAGSYDASALATWYEVQTADTMEGSATTGNFTYWVDIARTTDTHTVQIVKATPKTGETDAYDYVKYAFDFSAVTFQLPFTVKAATDAQLADAKADAEDVKAAADFQGDLTITATPNNSRKVSVSGDSKYVESWKWFYGEANAAQSEGHYVALNVTPAAGQSTPEVTKITFFSPADGPNVEKTAWQKDNASADGTFVWKLKEAQAENTTIRVKAYFDDNSGVNCYIDVSSMALKEKDQPPVTGDLTLTFGISSATGTTLLGKSADDLVEDGANGTLTGNTYKVEGTAKHVKEWTAFNGSDVNEQKGNYLPLVVTLPANKTASDVSKVVVTGGKTKEFTGSQFFDENEGKSTTLIMRLNALTGRTDVDDLTFTIAVITGTGEDAKTVTYTIDCSAMVLTPEVTTKTENGKTQAEVEVKPENIKSEESEGGKTTATITGTTPQGTTADKTTVTLKPETVKDLTDTNGEKQVASLTVATDIATVTLPDEALAKLDTNTHATEVVVEKNETVISITSGADSITPTSVVDVTVKVNNNEVLSTENNVKLETPITISIPVSSAGDYHVLYVPDDGDAERVTYSPVTVTEQNKVVSFQVKHLSTYAVVSKTDGEKVAAGSDVVKPALTADSVYAANQIGRKVTISNLTAGKVTVQLKNGAAAVVLTMTPNNGKVEFNANANTIVEAWDGEVTFANGVVNTNSFAHLAPYTVPANTNG